MGHALIAAAAEAGHPDHPARHLYLTSTCGRRAAGRARSCGSATATLDGWSRPGRRRCKPAGRTLGSARPSTRCGRCRPAELAGFGRADRGPAAARAPVRAARRERGLPGRARPHPDRAARRRRRCSARGTTAVHATHLTDDDRTAARRHRHRRLPLPDHRTRPGRRHRPGPRARRRRQPAVPRQRQPRRHRPVRGGARGGAATSGCATERRGHFAAAELLAAATVAGHAALGWADAGTHRRRAPGPTWSPSGWTRSARPDDRPRRPRRCSPPRPPTSRHVVVDGREVVRDGVHLLRPTWPRAARRGRGGVAVSLLDRGIGELVTNDPALGDGPLGVRGRGAGRRRRPGRLGRAGRARRRPPTGGSTPTGGAVLPGFVDSHAHLVFAGDRAAEFAARMAGEPYTGGGIRTTVAATRAASDDELRANVAPAASRGAAAGHHHDRDQERVRPDASPTRPARLRIAARAHRRDHVPRRPRRPGRVRRPRRRLRGAGLRRRCSRAAAPHARWVDVFCERGAFDADQSRAVLDGRRRRPGCGPRIHANQLGAGPRRAARRRARRGQRRPLHPPERRRRRRRWPARPPWPRCCPGAEFSTRSPYPDARAAARRRRDRRAGDRLQPRLVVHVVDAVLHRAGRARDADDAGRGAVGGDRRRRAGAAPRRRRPPRPRRAGRPGRPRRAVLPAPGLPARGARWSSTFCSTESRHDDRHRPAHRSHPPPTCSPSPAATPGSSSAPAAVDAMATSRGHRRRHRARRAARSTASRPASARWPTRSSRRSGGPSCSTR